MNPLPSKTPEELVQVILSVMLSERLEDSHFVVWVLLSPFRDTVKRCATS